MSSLPCISHHLFVAAVDHERRRDEVTPPRLPEAQQASATQSTAPEPPGRQINLDCAVDWSSGSSLVKET
jgi:hypothetical protein